MIKFDFKGEHVLVSGATSGIGHAVALEFAKAGAELTLLARRESELSLAAEECRKLGAKAVHILPADLEKPQQLMALLEQHLESNKPGGDTLPIRIFLNNAGGPPPGALIKASQEDFILAFQRLLLSAHLIVQKLLPNMSSAQYGRIINIISTSVREPLPNLGVSNVIRAATAAWAKTLANEMPPGVSVNNILPGYTKTDRLKKIKENQARSQNLSESEVEAIWINSVPERRLAEPEEIAKAVLFLASRESGYIRGVSLPVDGGRLRSL